MMWLLGVFVFIFGTIIGSFLNAVLWRLRTRESIVIGRSHCTTCEHVLAPGDLVPVLSFLLLRGKCRYCKAGIHPSYILVELAVGALFLLFASRAFANGPLDGIGMSRLLLQWYFAAALTLVFVYDLRYMLIPRALTLPATVVAALAGLALGMSPVGMALGMIVGGGIFWLQYVVSKGRWIGGGDISLGVLMGAMLGWPLTLVALFLAYVGGALICSVMLLSRRSVWNSQIPFGTFLSVATLATLLWGAQMLAWYLHLIF
jgi:leader peptidase (prepilin peptidase)/N-methyltransferase